MCRPSGPAKLVKTGILEGAPELVIEVLSPSNSASRMYRLERLCMNNGCQEFWTVDLDDQSIRVVRGDKVTVYERVRTPFRYRCSTRVQLPSKKFSKGLSIRSKDRYTNPPTAGE